MTLSKAFLVTLKYGLLRHLLWQALYRGELPVHKFFCAPLLSELAAVEELSRPATDESAPLAASLAPPLASAPPDFAGQDQVPAPYLGLLMFRGLYPWRRTDLLCTK